MKHCRMMLVGAVSWLAFQTSAAAAQARTADHPYRAIATRNVFGIRPAQRPPEVIALPSPPIILQGVTAYPWGRQALFRVGPRSFLLNEGEQQGGIEVLEINGRAGTVTVRHHGRVEVLNLHHLTGRNGAK